MGNTIDILDTEEVQAWLKEASRAAVNEIAADEADLFDEMVDAYLKDPESFRADSSADDDALGFGIEAISAMTPVVLSVAAAVAGFIGNTILGAAKDAASDAIQDRVKAFFARLKPGGSAGSGGAGEAAETPILNRAQLAQVHEAAVAEAIAHGMSADEAERLSRALVGSLVLGS